MPNDRAAKEVFGMYRALHRQHDSFSFADDRDAKRP
jgi:hypothetical protein